MSWKLIAKAERRRAREIALLRPAAGGSVRVALGYPNTYSVGMSNLGMQAVYGFLNRIPGVACERFFLPDPEELREYAGCGRRLFTMESQRPVGEFDLVAFSCSYENDYPHLLRLLEMAGLPLFSEERSDSHPLVLVGGAVTFLNPEPLADFVDAFCIGEGEGMVEPLVEVLQRRPSRPDLLREIARIPGYYVPSLYTPMYRRGRYAGLRSAPGAPLPVAKNYLDAEAFRECDTASWILTEDTEFGCCRLLEVSRGCPYVCRFCTVGFSYPRIRWKPAERIRTLIEETLEYTRRVGLVSATVGNHPEIRSLCRWMVERGVTVSFSSLRADFLPDEILEALVRGGSRTLTLAPETGSEGLRRAINKRFTDEQYLEAVRRSFRAGVLNLKMYAMVGLPHETDADVDALVDLVRRTRQLQKEEGRGAGRVVVSVGQFIPKPFTTFQWEGLAPSEVAAARIRRVEEALRGVGGVQVRAESTRVSLLEALLSRADRRMGRVLARVYRRPGFPDWMNALEREGLNLEELVFRPREPGEPLPWDHFQASWTPDRLQRDLRRATPVGGRA